MKLDPSAADIIATPERTLEVSIPVRMDDGTTKVFTGYRSQHSTIMDRLKAAFVIIPESTWTKKDSGFLDDLQIAQLQVYLTAAAKAA